MSTYGEHQQAEILYWWKSKYNKRPEEWESSVYGIVGTMEEPDPKEIDECGLTLFHYGTRNEMVSKLKNGVVV